MDWKILVGVLFVLLAFSIYRCTGDDGPADFKEAQAAAQAKRQADYERSKQAASSKAALKKERDARRKRGKRAKEEVAVLENDLVKASLTTYGGALKSFLLKDEQFQELTRDWKTGGRTEKSGPINLVTTNPNNRYWALYPLRLHIYEGLDGLLPDADFELVRHNSVEAVFRYAQPDQPVVIYKKYELAKKNEPYQFWLTVRFVNVSQEPVSFRAGLIQTGFQPEQEAKSGMFSPQPNLQVAECLAGDDLISEPWKEIEEPITRTGVSFAGVGNNYFVAAMMPEGEFPTACRISRLSSATVVRTDLQWGQVDLDPGKDVVLRVRNYMGPKKYQQLERVGHQLERSVDYGIFAPISRVLLWLLFQFQKLVVNWGVAIILLTVTIKLVLVPLTNKSFKSSNAMKELKPEMDALNEKYKDDPQEKQRAIMALYKSRGINPLGGCLPMVLQMPIWFALFRTLRSSPELYRAPFFGWITDLSDADPYFITPLVMGVTMFIQQRMMPTGTDNAQMKMMMYVMPVMFTVMMVFLPSGLTLYILVSTVLSILHQWILKKRSA